VKAAVLKLKRRFFPKTSKHPIPMLKKLSLVGLLSVAGLFSNSALADGWQGYMNVFSTGSGTVGSGYIFGSGWGLSDVRTTIENDAAGTTIGDQLRLEPNYNTYANSLGGNNDDRAFWTNSSNGGATAGPLGNKFMEANTFFETASIVAPSVNFSGTVNSYTLAGEFTAVAFIKVLNQSNNYNIDVLETFNLNSGAQFSLNADLSTHAGKILQVGYAVYGTNANPANAVSNGSVLVTVTAAAIPEPSSFALIGAGVALFAASFRRRRA
jgi:hypothetical protein